MSDTLRVRVVFNDFPRIIAHIHSVKDQVVEDAAKRFYDETQDTVPVLTGDLKGSGHIEDIPNGKRVVYDAENSSGDCYGGFVEWGTRFTPANPFAGTAFERSIGDVINTAVRAFTDLG